MIISASRRIAAAPETIYNIVADYRDGHPRILPKQFQSLVVEEGGCGAGTVIRCQIRAFGTTQTFRASITEPRPGRELVETNISGSDSVTTFTVEPVPGTTETNVTISTNLKTRAGLPGRLEGFLSRRLLQPIYVEELALLDKLSREI